MVPKVAVVKSATGAHQLRGIKAILRVLRAITNRASGITTLDCTLSAICPANGAIKIFGISMAKRIRETPVGPTASLSRRITAKVVRLLPM
jgi:hypothetical protein